MQENMFNMFAYLMPDVHMYFVEGEINPFIGSIEFTIEYGHTVC